MASTLALSSDGATHVGVASDHTIESFRNDLYDGYKDGEGMDEDILRQIPVMEDALAAAGFTVWPMVLARGRRRAWPLPPPSPMPTNGSNRS